MKVALPRSLFASSRAMGYVGQHNSPDKCNRVDPQNLKLPRDKGEIDILSRWPKLQRQWGQEKEHYKDIWKDKTTGN
jgi:hypothetical protein